MAEEERRQPEWAEERLGVRLRKVLAAAVTVGAVVVVVMLVPTLREFSGLTWRAAAAVWTGGILFMLAVEVAQWRSLQPTKLHRSPRG